MVRPLDRRPNVDVTGRVTAYQYDKESRPIKVTDPFGRIESRQYDEDGKLVSVTDSEGKVTQYEYDLEGRVIRTSDSLGRVATSKYDEDGRLVRTVDRDGNVVTNLYDDATGLLLATAFPAHERHYDYDLRGRLAKTIDLVSGEARTNAYEHDAGDRRVGYTDAEGGRTAWAYDLLGRRAATVNALSHTNGVTYDSRGNITAIADAKGNVTQFEYDSSSRLVKKTYPDETFVSYAYDAVGRLTEKVDAKGQMILYRYDALGRLGTNEFYASTNAGSPEKTVGFQYDDYGRMVGYDDGVTAGAYVYDDEDRTVAVTIDYGAFSKSYRYELDAYGRKTAFVGPEGTTNRFSYDAGGRLSEIAVPGEGTISYAGYEPSGPTAVGLPGGLTKSFAYDPLSGMISNEVRDAAGNTVMSRSYARNKTGNITASETEHGPYAYSYDAIDQLTGVDYPTLPDETFAYDPAGNRTASTISTVSTNLYTVNDLNQYTQVSSFEFQISLSYDLNGSLTQKLSAASTETFRCNIEDRLVAYTNSETGVSAEYYYDPFGRRLRKAVNGVTNWFLYADEGLVAEMDSSGRIGRAYGYKPNTLWMNDPLFVRITNFEFPISNIYYYASDHLGAPQKVVGRNGELVWNAEFEAFGQAHLDPSSSIANHLRFSSQYWDEEAGTYSVADRYYDAGAGAYVGSRTEDLLEDLSRGLPAMNNPVMERLALAPAGSISGRLQPPRLPLVGGKPSGGGSVADWGCDGCKINRRRVDRAFQRSNQLACDLAFGLCVAPAGGAIKLACLAEWSMEARRQIRRGDFYRGYNPNCNGFNALHCLQKCYIAKNCSLSEAERARILPCALLYEACTAEGEACVQYCGDFGDWIRDVITDRRADSVGYEAGASGADCKEACRGETESGGPETPCECDQCKVKDCHVRFRRSWWPKIGLP